jgi:hypothetical protein
MESVMEHPNLGPLFEHKPTQEEVVLNLLKKGDVAMPTVADPPYCIHRLSERIRRLKKTYIIENVQKEYRTVYAVYRLIGIK